MLGSVRADSSITDLRPGTGSIYIVTDTPDTLYERARTAGATITMEMREEHYGSRASPPGSGGRVLEFRHLPRRRPTGVAATGHPRAVRPRRSILRR